MAETDAITPDELVDRLQAAYDTGLAFAGELAERIGANTRERPWLALVAALGLGLVIGRAHGRSGRKLAYVRKR